MKNTFAHDLRNLLNYIHGYNALLADDLSKRSASGEMIEILKTIDENGKFLQTFVETWFGDIRNNEDWRMPALEALVLIQEACKEALPNLTDSEAEDLHKVEESARDIVYILLGRRKVPPVNSTEHHIVHS